ncbi:hypothetical protein J6590_001510 [Homalodisca vitripennis]|nr:hypothetical protein J6590_001510 [Homalodisca vitripennis]
MSAEPTNRKGALDALSSTVSDGRTVLFLTILGEETRSWWNNGQRCPPDRDAPGSDDLVDLTEESDRCEIRVDKTVQMPPPVNINSVSNWQVEEPKVADCPSHFPVDEALSSANRSPSRRPHLGSRDLRISLQRWPTEPSVRFPRMDWTSAKCKVRNTGFHKVSNCHFFFQIP